MERERTMICLRLARIVALFLGVSLMLGAAAREAGAGACGKLDEDEGCVIPNDVDRNAVRANHRLDEAGTDFDSKPGTPVAIKLAETIYATVVVSAPAAGTIIVNASITVQALPDPGPGTGPGVRDGRGTVECALTNGGTFIDLNNPNRFFGSVDWDDDIEYETLSITRGFTVSRKIDTTIALSCGVLPGSAFSDEIALLRVTSPSLTAQYFSNRN